MSSKQLTRKVKDHFGNEHEVHKWYQLKNRWEFYQIEKADDFGVVYGYMTSCPYPEFGSQHTAELHDVAGLVVEKFDLWQLAPPQGWEWLEKEN